ncbi:hypothetical protein TNCV_2859141 [Trichonephila clavipes]|nr:hypothetical protein TNCV_2859141 [Trichonephila clavipes]
MYSAFAAWGTVNSRRAALLGRLVEGEERELKRPPVGVVVRRGCASSGFVHVTWPWFKITWSVAKSPRVAEHCVVNNQSINQFGVSGQSLASNGPVVDSRDLNLVFGPTEETHDSFPVPLNTQ